MAHTEHVVLLDDEDRPIGTAPKALVHTADTPLHLAFSCYVFNQHGELLITRRSLQKAAWPGVWTNSFCGHPAPDEPVKEAVVRRARQELGAELTDVQAIAPDFRYRAVDASGVVENELCPVHTATIASPLDADPTEIMEWQWVPLEHMIAAAENTPFAFSPWLILQLPLLATQDADR